ncbi:MAG: elongation factor P [Crocinitomicaceae bacterium]|jgi:elongation factor P
MLNYNEIKDRKYIIVDGEPYEVVSAQVSRKQANKPVNKTKLKSLMNGRVVEHTFHMSDKVHEADMSKKNYVYIYSKGDELWFHAEGDKSDRFAMNGETVGSAIDYILEGDTVEFSVFTNDEDEEVLTGVNLPIKMELEVVEAPPAIKGNTATGGDKLVTTKTGLKVTAPLFINIGDIIAVNTDAGTYSERVSKA